MVEHHADWALLFLLWAVVVQFVFAVDRKSVCMNDGDKLLSVCNVYLFDANSAIQSVPLISTENHVPHLVATYSELWLLVRASCCDERQLCWEKWTKKQVRTSADLQHPWKHTYAPTHPPTPTQRTVTE